MPPADPANFIEKSQLPAQLIGLKLNQTNNHGFIMC